MWYLNSVGSCFRGGPEDLSPFWVWEWLAIWKEIDKILEGYPSNENKNEFKNEWQGRRANCGASSVELAMHRPSRSSAQKSHQEMHEAFQMCWTYCTGTGTGDHCVFFIFKSIKRHAMCKRRSYKAPSGKSDFCQVFPKSFCCFFVCLGFWVGFFLVFLGS